MRRWTMAATALALAVGLAVPMGSAQGVGTSRAVRPVQGPVIVPFDPPGQPWEAGNRGAKLAAEPGQAVRAALDGTVRFAGQVAGQPWVTVDHGGGLDTTYGVVDPGVGPGRRVRAGEVIGTLAEGADHLHWGARLDGGYIDPLSLLGRWRPRLVAHTGPARAAAADDRPPVAAGPRAVYARRSTRGALRRAPVPARRGARRP